MSTFTFKALYVTTTNPVIKLMNNRDRNLCLHLMQFCNVCCSVPAFVIVGNYEGCMVFKIIYILNLCVGEILSVWKRKCLFRDPKLP